MNSLNVEDKPKVLVPAPAALDAWSTKTWADGIQINELKQLDTLSIETMHHTYEMTIINPDTAEVLVRGGEFFPEATLAQVRGASLRSSFIKLHGIYIGFNLELSVSSKPLITSRVRSIRLSQESDCQI